MKKFNSEEIELIVKACTRETEQMSTFALACLTVGIATTEDGIIRNPNWSWSVEQQKTEEKIIEKIKEDPLCLDEKDCAKFALKAVAQHLTNNFDKHMILIKLLERV